MRGEYIELVHSPYYWKLPELSSDNSTNTDTIPPISEFALSIVVGAVGARVVVLVGGFVILNKYP